MASIDDPEFEARIRAEERRGEEAAFELLELVTRDSALRAKLDAGDFERLLNDVKGIASEEVIEMLTRVRDAKASDMGNIDDSDEPRFRWLSYEDIRDLSARLRQSARSEGSTGV